MQRFRPKRKDLTPLAGAQRRGQDDPTALALDVTPKVRKGAAKANVIIDEHAGASGLNISCKRGLERQAVKTARSGVSDGVGLVDLSRHRERKALAEGVGHGIRDEIDAGHLDGPHGNEDRPLVSQKFPDAVDGSIGQECSDEPNSSLSITRLRRSVVRV